MLDNTLCLYSMENGWLVQSHTFYSTITHVQWLDNIGFIAHIAGARDVCIMRLVVVDNSYLWLIVNYSLSSYVHS